MFGVPNEKLLPFADRVYFCAIAIAAVFTIIGVVSGFAQYRLNARINETKDRALAAFQSDAATKISLANERAAKLEADAAESNRRLEATRLALEQERTNRVKLIATLAARHIPSEKITDIQLAVFGKIPRIVFSFLTGDPEALAFAQDVHRAIENTGATIVMRGAGFVSSPGGSPTGLVISIPDDSYSFLPAAFERAGVSVTMVISPGSDVTISVGIKPPPF
jgi:hypothetical protein